MRNSVIPICWDGLLLPELDKGAMPQQLAQRARAEEEGNSLDTLGVKGKLLAA
ncbi:MULTISPECIES: hypothetical protein [unclassified Coleofasciculus]|uniref:hypothetical protein n=1 Tax=unclassified Coleofasciculus TaxID=2692782 RepID=UPI001882444A|nr:MULTISPECIES: hypothetical protein [unclassified Coleofasciculus]MBE9127302.1 hypothetical protein [Coleofasciculus sp. LEGE 07081]MBE9150809.1 hypothetical protein [Coleofasciculus sp. LEGE 07092]